VYVTRGYPFDPSLRLAFRSRPRKPWRTRRPSPTTTFLLVLAAETVLLAALCYLAARTFA
jgi:hypothetical protein